MSATRSIFPGLVTGFLMIFGNALSSFGQTPGREFTNQTNGLRYRVIGRDTSLVIDKMAAFPGGNAALAKYLQKGMVYPPAVNRKGIEGLVKAGFIVGTSGDISSVTIKESLHPQLDSLVMDLVQKMPAWSPSLQGNRPVKTAYLLPVRFTHLTEATRENVRTYQAGGVEFKHLKNWEAGSLPLEKGTEVKFSRKGFGKSGTVFIAWQPDTVSLAARMQAERDRLSQKFAGNARVTFGKPVASRYNKYKALRTTGFLEFNNLAGSVAGRMTLEIYAFNAGYRSFVVRILEFEEDKHKINTDLGVIEAGFRYPAAN